MNLKIKKEAQYRITKGYLLKVVSFDKNVRASGEDRKGSVCDLRAVITPTYTQRIPRRLSR